MTSAADQPMPPAALITDATLRHVTTRPWRIDWFRVIVDLERSGLFQHEIGAAAGISQAQVSGYKSIPNTEPTFHVGMLLLGLWSERVGRADGPPLCR